MNSPLPLPKAGFPFGKVLWRTVATGAALAFIALFFGKRDWAIGFFAGGILSALGFLALKAFSSKILSLEPSQGRMMFLVLNPVRWLLLAVCYYFLLQVSVACLLCAIAVHILFLTFLGWSGVREAPPFLKK